MSNPFGLAKRLTRPFINRASRRQRENAASGDTDSAPKLSSREPVIFETLEPRLLLAADPLGITAGYAFDEVSGTSAADASGHGIVGTLTNGATFTAGKYGNAVTLDGTNDFVNLGNPTALQLTGSMTVSAWVYATSFPADDAAVVSKRTAGEIGYQLDITKDTGPRTIGFKLTDSSGGAMFRYGATTLQPNTWYHIAGVYNAAAQTLDVYLNGVLDNGQLVGTITNSQRNSTANINIGGRPGTTFFDFAGRIDDVRIADHALTQAQIQTDMATPLGGTTPPPPDTTFPTVSLTPPASILAGTVNLAATASDNIGVVGVKFLLDGNTTIGSEDTTSPYGVSWNTTTASNGTHTLAAQARDAANNVTTTSTAFTVTVDNQPPTGTVAINAGAAATNNRTVTLTLSATDALGGVTQMRFSSNGTSYSAAEAYVTTRTWTLTTGAGTKTVYVQFQDAAGNWSTAATDTIVLDTTAPTVSARTVTNVTSNSVKVNWTTNEAATSQIEYGPTTSYGSLTLLDSNLVTAHSVLVSDLAPSATYNYRIRAVDAAGNQTISSNGTFTTAAGADTVAPSMPTGLTTTPISTTQINLSWNASTDNVGVTGYRVFRDGGSTPIATVTTTSYSDSGLTASTTYQYTVVAIDAAGNASGPSVAASATTPAPDTTLPTATITSPTGTSPLSGTVTITATAADNVGVAGVVFLVDGIALGNEDTTSPYSSTWDTTAAANGTHTLLARARDTAGNLGNSAPVTVTVSNTQTSGLVAAYAFNETSGTTTADGSGHSLTGALVNGATFAAGRSGNALTLDGVNDYVDLGNPTALQLTGSMTISAWIYSSGFPADDAVIVSKRAGGESGFQLDTTVDTGTRTIGFKLTNSSGAAMFRFGATTLQPNTWYYVTGVHDASAQTLHVYLNGVLDDGVLQGTVTASQQNSTQSVNVGQRPGVPGLFNFKGLIDDVRIYSRALTQSEIQTDMATPVGGVSSDPVAPSVSITAPALGTQVSDIVTVSATASDNVGVIGVQFIVDGQAVGAEDTAAPYALAWDSRAVTNGAHTLTARARDAAGNSTVSAPVTVNVANASSFQNEILATGFELPTSIEFLPNGDMLVVELHGSIWLLKPPYLTPEPTPFLHLTNVGNGGVQQGFVDIALDPNFATNHYVYVFYTQNSPNRDRLSRFTVNAGLTAANPASELVIYQDTQNANDEHHGGAINFGPDGKIYLTIGDAFNPTNSQDLTTPRGKVLRLNPDGTVPTDNPFYDGAGPNYDAIWALGLRNPYRAYYDIPTNRFYIADVGGNVNSTAIEEVNLGAPGANYGWANVETPNGDPRYTAPIYYYPHNGRDAAITGGFVYHGTQFPSSFQGVYFFGDYTQNWICYLTFDSNGNVTGVHNFEPANGAVDGPYGDIVYLTQGPEGALYYVDLGYSDVGSTFGVSKIRRISFINSDLPPVVQATASPTQGPTPLTVSFSSAGSSDPEGQPLAYSWNFGDGQTATLANPTHTYASAGAYQARLTVSDGTNSVLSTPISITAGSAPTATILAPTAGLSFRAGDVIAFSGDATDAEDGALPASAFTWTFDLIWNNHVLPGLPITGVKSGNFTVPTTGHDFHGDTSYRVSLTVTDSDGLQTTKVVFINPEKANITLASVPDGLTLYLDGIAYTGPLVYDDIVGFQHTIEARNTTIGANTYNFASWSDGGAQLHTITVPAGAQTYTATYNVVAAPVVPAFVQANAAVPQTNQTTVTVTYTGAQTAGNTNILAIGWNNATSNITSVVDSAGNVYQLAVPTARGSGLSQAIYYASNIKAAAAGTNTVTVTFNTSTPYVDIRALEYSGLDPVSPFDVGASSSGISATASSGSVATTAAHELIFAAGMTTGIFSGAGASFTTRIITSPDGDIAEDRFVTSTGTYSATASLGGSSAWVMQVAAFKAANQT